MYNIKDNFYFITKYYMNNSSKKGYGPLTNAGLTLGFLAALGGGDLDKKQVNLNTGDDSGISRTLDGVKDNASRLLSAVNPFSANEAYGAELNQNLDAGELKKELDVEMNKLLKGLGSSWKMDTAKLADFIKDTKNPSNVVMLGVNDELVIGRSGVEKIVVKYDKDDQTFVLYKVNSFYRNGEQVDRMKNLGSIQLNPKGGSINKNNLKFDFGYPSQQLTVGNDKIALSVFNNLSPENQAIIIGAGLQVSEKGSLYLAGGVQKAKLTVDGESGEISQKNLALKYQHEFTSGVLRNLFIQLQHTNSGDYTKHITQENLTEIIDIIKGYEGAKTNSIKGGGTVQLTEDVQLKLYAGAKHIQWNLSKKEGIEILAGGAINIKNVINVGDSIEIRGEGGSDSYNAGVRYTTKPFISGEGLNASLYIEGGTGVNNDHDSSFVGVGISGTFGNVGGGNNGEVIPSNFTERGVERGKYAGNVGVIDSIVNNTHDFTKEIGRTPIEYQNYYKKTVTEKNIPSAPSVSADDTNNTITGFDGSTMELSVSTNGGSTYGAYTSTVPDLSGDKTVKVRVKAQGGNPASADTVINFTTNAVIPSAPSVSADDTNNTITGFDGSTMELSVSTNGGSTYGAYTSTVPDLSGDKTVKVRVKAQGGNPASADTVINFTTNAVAPSAPSVSADDTNNTITGFDGSTMELSVSTNGGSTYGAYTSTVPDLSGDKTVKVRVKAQGGNPASADTV
ncbi:MAG: hypothetical protein PHN31_03240, partial [Candidatus Gracilibacteria bacterium]|nr:hypothetical protein [Candidatus Gracilibacteria bacterium]